MISPRSSRSSRKPPSSGAKPFKRKSARSSFINTGPERVVLVGVGLKSEASLIVSSLAELRRLAETAGAQVVAEFSQAVARFNPGTLIGKGKVEQVADAAQRFKASTIILDMELAPGQQKA